MGAGEPEGSEDEQFAREHVLLWVHVWPTGGPAPDAIADVERTLRAMPEFHELTVIGDPGSPRFDVWLRRDRADDDESIYMQRAADAVFALGNDAVGIELAAGDF
jgi:hypothetical protein